MLLFRSLPDLWLKMSYFSATLTRLLRNTTQAEVAGASGIPRSSIAQYATGDRGISVSALGQLLQAFPDPVDQLDLVRAHLRDETPPEVAHAVFIDTRTDVVREDPPPAEWHQELGQALELLRVYAEKDPDVRRVVLDLAKILA
jgi:transcriptional regulator with XRE-family HTH domain